MAQAAFDDEADRLARELAGLVSAAGLTVATAESLTGGQLAAALSAAPDAGAWYRGGIVAYHPAVKHTLLGTPEGSVVTAPTAVAMARSAAELLMADCTAALTGVGGPGPQEGRSAGTVYIATRAPEGGVRVELHRFAGDPLTVMEQTIHAALQALIARVSGSI